MALKGLTALSAALLVAAATTLPARAQTAFVSSEKDDKLTVVSLALIIGGDEAATGVVSLKDMAAGTQEKLTPAEAAAKINAALAPRRRAQAIRG